MLKMSSVETSLKLQFEPSDEFIKTINETVQNNVTDKIMLLAEHIDQVLGEVLLDREQVAKMLGISLPTLDARVKDGQLPSIRIGNRIRFRKTDVLKLPGAKLMVTPREWLFTDDYWRRGIKKRLDKIKRAWSNETAENLIDFVLYGKNEIIKRLTEG